MLIGFVAAVVAACLPPAATAIPPVDLYSATNFITEVSNQVLLINGADPANVFWQVGSSATLKTGSQFAGNMLAYTSISLADGSNVEGRLLALNGLVSLVSNNVGMPVAAVPEPGTLLLLLCSGIATVVVFSRRFFFRP